MFAQKNHSLTDGISQMTNQKLLLNWYSKLTPSKMDQRHVKGHENENGKTENGQKLRTFLLEVTFTF